MLRTSLSLSLVTGQPFRMVKIRAGREKPGLLRQHLAAVLAATEIGHARVEGAQLGSQALTFEPGTVSPGDYHFIIGTAGSGTLVFQTVLPALMIASGPSRLKIEGGTHNNSAPPFDYLDRCFLPLVNQMGPSISLKLDRHGFYPAGGGCFCAEVIPCPKLKPLHVGPRGPVLRKRARAVISNLPGHIAEREIETVQRMLNGEIETEIIASKQSPGPGNALMIEFISAGGCEMFTTFGQIGVTAENVARHAVREARDYLISDALAGEHLSDQLLLPMAMTGGGSFTASKISSHATTNMDVIQRSLPVRFETRRHERFTTIEVVT